MDATRATIRLYWQHAWRYPRYVLGILLSLPLTVLLNAYLPPLILASVLSRLARSDFQPHHVWASFGPSLVGYALLMFVGLAGWRVVDYFAWRLEANVQRDLAQRIFGHLMDMSADFHANHFGGSLVSQTNKVLGAYIRMADTTIFQVLPLFSGLLWACLILAHRAPLFTVVFMGFSLLYISGSFFVTRKVRRLSTAHAELESKQTGHLADGITNVMAIKSFSGGDYERQRFAKATVRTRTHLMKFASAQQRFITQIGLSTRFISASSLFLAVASVMLFRANIATVFLILSYTSNIVDQLFTFSNNSLRNYNRAVGDASEMLQILEIEPEVKDPVQPETPHIQSGAITFDDVTFKHSGAGDALFSQFNLTIAAGERVGLIGHSGSGKTTLTRLLLRFSDINAGDILIDGQNIAHITQDDLRRNIAYVPQEPMLFHRTIAENISYGRPAATLQEVETAARQAHAHEFIKRLPQGYDTLVGERGVKLSGGQRQRVAIARAMLKDAPILVLDEATSALDSESEALIQDALWKLMQGRTAIVIAHRLSTIQHMDRIVVLDHGEIKEQGTHKTLLRQNGLYAQLWARQSGGFIEE